VIFTDYDYDRWDHIREQQKELEMRTRYAEALGRIEVWQGDITTMAVDAIVNAANERMLGGGGVDGAIHRAAGPWLYWDCLNTPEVRPDVRCPTGEARITRGFSLPARRIIHTVGPVWNNDGTEPELLARCYRNSLSLARDNSITAIAFPAISTGVYGFPKPLAAQIAVREAQSFLANNQSPRRVVFVAFSLEDLNHYETALRGAK
jgi:O-acetyl-ADP-ribose deacetylase